MDGLNTLYNVILERKQADPGSSYTAGLFATGMDRIAQKVGEESFETVIAALHRDNGAVVSESADLLYHLLVLWADLGIKPAQVIEELDRRAGISGIEEKKSRHQS